MDNVPRMISTKDLEYIKDMLNWNYVACKKANHYLEHIRDDEVKDAVTVVANMHNEHYKFILNILK
jgi:hypothetical protein